MKKKVLEKFSGGLCEGKNAFQHQASYPATIKADEEKVVALKGSRTGGIE